MKSKSFLLRQTEWLHFKGKTKYLRHHTTKKTFTINYEEYYLTHIDQHSIGKLVFKARFNTTRIQNINSHISTKTLISHC